MRQSGLRLIDAQYGTTHKKVIVRKMDRDTVNGYVRAAFIADGKLELLNTAGNVVAIALRRLRASTLCASSATPSP